MKFSGFVLLILLGCVFSIDEVQSQSVLFAKDFKLASPFSEPDGRNDVVKLSDTDFITLAKVKGSQSGKSDFVLERYDSGLNSLWQVPLSAEVSEDYKNLYFNGKELMLLSVVHQESEKKTKLVTTAFDVKDGAKLWSNELESYTVGDWENHPHKGKVKETFIDVVCEHTNQDFITPFEYKHYINFSPDQSKFVSYVYNYGEPSLTASVNVYDNSGNILKKGKVSIDNDYTNYGIYVNNAGIIYILNASNMGKINLIQYNMDTKDFQILDLPSSNYLKDDFHIKFLTDDEIFVGNNEMKDGKIYGVMYSKFNFNKKLIEYSVFKDFDQTFKSKFLAERTTNKQMKGDENWLDYDITHFQVNANEEVLMVLEKRSLHADGYPHVGRDVFDKSHKVEFTGHVQAEAILMFAFDKSRNLKWENFIFKNQIYPVTDGLNTISFVLDNNSPSEIRVVYASSESVDGSLRGLNLISIDKTSGKVIRSLSLPNDNKLTLVREYTLFGIDNSLTIVGKKGLLGKASMMVKYKLP